jgi:hypothetical protein
MGFPKATPRGFLRQPPGVSSGNPQGLPQATFPQETFPQETFPKTTPLVPISKLADLLVVGFFAHSLRVSPYTPWPKPHPCPPDP